MLSKNYKTWKTTLDFKTCVRCSKLHGKVYFIEEIIEPSPPLHERCRCVIEFLEALFAGTATFHGTDGADWWMKHYGRLPDYYISKQDAKKAGWIDYKGNLHRVLPGIMIFGGVYDNDNGHLPSAPGRVWYEADINYTEGYRNKQRLLFSNDGLIFATYDHYKTFYEIC